MRSWRRMIASAALVSALVGITACGGSAKPSSATGTASHGASAAVTKQSTSPKGNSIPLCTLITKQDIIRLTGKKILSSDADQLSIKNDPNYCEFITNEDTFNNITIFRIPEKTMDLPWAKQAQPSDRKKKLDGRDAIITDKNAAGEGPIVMIRLGDGDVAFVQNTNAGLDTPGVEQVAMFAANRMLAAK